MDVKIHHSWKTRLSSEFDKPYFLALTDFVKNEYKTATVYPPGKDIFRAFDCCPFEALKVVIIGQDPYHGPKQANGLCFSVSEEVPLPPSLQNIFKERADNLNKPPLPSGDLTRWAYQGVLLLNSILTVRASTPGSHQNKGWETFTDAVIQLVSDQKESVVFILWGSYAQHKGAVIDSKKHLVIQSPHPSPFSVHRGFYGSKPFSKTNEYLLHNGKTGIDW
jgi:uracil-DNA glycosylase